ncbi:MAG: helicase HerA-like domain-containing protein [Thermodesulfobacteriota bacterium]
MENQGALLLGRGEEPQYLLLQYANRHGLIAGATGTGKTVSLQVLAEGLSRAGVPVFMADVKGDLAGMSQAGEDKPKLRERAESLGIEDYTHEAFPTIYWDLLGEQGHPVRTTISEMGPLLLSRLLGLNEAQEGVLNIVFRLADEQGLLLLDLKDLRAMLQFAGEQSKDLTIAYGNVTKPSVGAIQRRILVLEEQGGDKFFGEPALDLNDFMRTDEDGRGLIGILAADKLMLQPRLYATFMLWLLAELFEELPEVGDPEKPKLVFFFDEAHLLFSDAPKVLIEKVEQVARLVRSKGVGVYFISQSPLDIPEVILGQLGNRIQHGMRAFTPRDQKTVRVVAETFRTDRSFDCAQAITELQVGEALVSTLDEKGAPRVVQRVMVRPPSSRMGPVIPQERMTVIRSSPIKGKYDETVDRESAFEMLKERAEATAAPAGEQQGKSWWSTVQDTVAGMGTPTTGRGQSVGDAFAKSVARSIGGYVGRAIIRGVLGSILKR